MNILFVCSANYQRSKTAEDYFKTKFTDHQFKSAGTNHKECTKRGTIALTDNLMVWADKVFVMEDHHLKIINDHSKKKYENKIAVLGIEDVYQYNSPEFIRLLIDKVKL